VDQSGAERAGGLFRPKSAYQARKKRKKEEEQTTA